MARALPDGADLDGSKHNYTLTFAKDEYPPVNAFWPVTMYDGKTQLLIKNPIDRYLINSPMLPSMNKNSDGSLTLYIQKDSPGKDKEADFYDFLACLLEDQLQLTYAKAIELALAQAVARFPRRRAGSMAAYS